METYEIKRAVQTIEDALALINATLDLLNAHAEAGVVWTLGEDGVELEVLPPLPLLH